MGVEMLEIVVKMRKIAIFTIRRCYTSVCSHPFLVGMLCFLVILYRSSPFLFSLLVSASPVLVCTAILLGTLLSFGQSNVPEIERDEKISHEIASLRTGVCGDAIVVEKNEHYSVEKFTDERGDVVEKLNGVASLIVNGTSVLHRGDNVDSGVPLAEERCREMEFDNKGHEEKNKINDERLVDGEAKTDDEDLELENDKSPAESFDSERVNVDSLDSPPGSPWKHVEEGDEQERQEEEEEEEDDEALDSGSDRAESSSPDASMADIIPMLDELHPLLDEDTTQPVSLSHDGSDAASERSLKSSDSSSELDDDNDEKHENAVAADEENEDADDEDEARANTEEGQTKSAITWTEEDQKNLMDLGTSELERNQRLESLIARRRARKTMSMMAERNLIDLDSADLPFTVAPISTARNNPFDLPPNTYDDMGLPPIPGSAPSILLQRRNPFDLPYDSSEEKPDLMGDSFQQEFTSFQPKEPFFRRHESFNIGPSFFGPTRQERQDGRLRPYFITERGDSDGVSYSSFQRQSSGLSDSKASSVPETDSVASTGDVDEKNLVEENISNFAEPLSSVPEMELKGPAGDMDDKDLSEEDISYESDLMSMNEDKRPNEEDILQDQELISKIEHVSEHVGHGSQSSEESDSSELGEVENRDVEPKDVEISLQHVECRLKLEPTLLEERSDSNCVEFYPPEAHLDAEAVKQGNGSTSSSSSLSEVSERILLGREAEGLPNFIERTDDIVEEAGFSGQPSREGSDLNMTSDNLHKEPVYDSSPPAVRKNLSSSSISSDLLVESEMQPVLIKRTVSFVERESESVEQDREKNAPEDNNMSVSVAFTKDDNQSEARMETETSVNHIIRFDFSGANQVSNSTSASVLPETIWNHASGHLKSSLDTSVEGDLMYQHGSEHQDGQSFSLIDAGVHLVIDNAVPHTAESVATSEDQKLPESGQPHSLALEQVKLVSVPYTVSKSMEEHPEHSVGDGVCIEQEERQISVPDHSSPEEKLIAEYGEELVFLDKTVDETASRNNHEEQETAVLPEEIIEELSSRANLGAEEPEQEVSPNINSPTSPESISILSEGYESRAPEGYSDVESNSVHDFGNDERLEALEDRNSAGATNSQVNVQNIYDNDADQIKEIDEVLLSELDAVGDFSVNELCTTFSEFEKLVASVEEFSVSHETVCNSTALDDVSTEMHDDVRVLHVMTARPSQDDDVTQNKEEVKCVSEPQTSGANTTELANLSSENSMEVVQIQMDPKSTEEEMFPRQNLSGISNSRIEQNAEVVNPEMPMVDGRLIEDIEAISIPELTSEEKEIILGSTEVPPQGEANEASSSGMPVLEARTLLDIASAFKQISGEIIEKTNIGELPSPDQDVEKPAAQASRDHEEHEGSSPPKHMMDSPIHQTRSLEDAHLDLKQSQEVHAERDLHDSVEGCLHEGEFKDSEQSSSEISLVGNGSLNDPSLALRQALEHQQDKPLESSAVFEENEAGNSSNLHSNAKELDEQEVTTGGPKSLTTDVAKKEGESSHKSSSSSSSSDSDKE